MCIHVSTEVLEEPTRCNSCDTHCTSVGTSVFERRGGGCIKEFVNGRKNIVYPTTSNSQ